MKPKGVTAEMKALDELILIVLSFTTFIWTLSIY